MPHPATDAHVHLARHPQHPDAVTATITGAGTYTARALLTVHGFRQVGEQTMILARIDHEEPHYAHRAAHALREEGVIVHITPGLQEGIDTEWTWANYPMHWLNRDEIRDVSAAAQKIHDDIASGRLVIHLHTHDGHTTLAVGTYRGGKSVHLHGEDHLRQVALAYDNPSEALAEFARLYGEVVRPGPAPATDIEQRAAAALATIAGGPMATPPDTSQEPDRPAARTVPMYAGDPGDHETLLNTFLESQGEWEKYRTFPIE
ncbi:hypothetical protein OG427_07310 [Streptomyces sp. NBC_00133]|uniref:hypothetical protein n=1 Tax=Streptomyces sp. NBC_00133 TaxID=2903624 RepID=UPI003250F3E6